MIFLRCKLYENCEKFGIFCFDVVWWGCRKLEINKFDNIEEILMMGLF